MNPVSSNKLLSSSFRPPRLMQNHHLQNMLSSFGLRKFLLRKRYTNYIQSTREIILTTPHKVRLSAKLNCHNSQAKSLIILIHGWEGSSDSAYLLSMAARLYDAGHDTLRLQLRDHGNTTHLNKKIFNSSLIDEVVDAIAVFQNEHNYAHFGLAGFSLGGNFSLRCALRSASLSKPLDLVLAVCPVLDPAKTMVSMKKTLSLYDRYFVKKWKRSLTEKLKYFPEYEYRNTLKKLRSLQEMNNYFIPRYTEFSNVEDYFQSYTITGNTLQTISNTTLIIASKDDPIIPADDFEMAKLSSTTKLEMYRHGSHCAFLKNARLESWLDDKAVTYFSPLANSHRPAIAE